MTSADGSPSLPLRLWSGAALLALVLVVLVVVTQHHLRQHTGVRTSPCPLGARLVPACGALLGIEPSSPTMVALNRAEAVSGHRFQLVYSFHDLNDTVPSTFDRQVVASGRVLHLDIDSADFTTGTTIPWSAVADGEYDAELVRLALGVAALKVPVFVTFDHEPDQAVRTGAGTPAQYVAAWRHVHDVFLANGADNAVWVWVVMAVPQTYAETPAFWPGDDAVDWISWDGYDDAGCRSGRVDPARSRSFAASVLGYLDWLRANPGTGIDLGKPMMISETATVAGGSSAQQRQWYAEMPSVLRANPQIGAVTLWDHTGSTTTCDYRFDADPLLAGSVARAAADPWFAWHPAR